MKIKNTRLAILKSCICLSIGFILTLSQLHGQVPSVAKVKNDFKRLLARPSVPLNTTLITSITTDSVIMDRGFFYSEATEKVPFLIYKPIGPKSKKWTFDGGIEDVKLLFQVGKRLAFEEKMPQWKVGSEFKAKRGEK